MSRSVDNSRDGPQAAKNIWTLLRSWLHLVASGIWCSGTSLRSSYKNDHAKSNLPSKIYSNEFEDPKLWKKGPLTTEPLAWHHFRSALGHHLIQHPQSPFDEGADRRVISDLPQIIARIAIPTTPTDPLFITPFTLAQVETKIRSSLPDKAPGLDGITNRMLRAAGPKFKQVLFVMYNTIWHHDSQPEVWQKSLIQPIFKGEKRTATAHPPSAPYSLSVPSQSSMKES